MEVITIPCLSDNYAYLIICKQTMEAAVVDAPEARPILRAARRWGVRLISVLHTHHHWDHVAGDELLLKEFPLLNVCGHISDSGRIAHQNVFLNEGDVFKVGKLKFTIRHLPGHTSGSIAYCSGGAVFVGDVLFAAGCGRVFEGTYEEMHRSLNEKIKAYPPQTQIYFGHEYLNANLRFALSVEPNNLKTKNRHTRLLEQQKAGFLNTPALLAEELETNPFLRCDSPEIQETVKKRAAGSDMSPVEVFRALRQMKDNF